jgi:hypothetical protein
MVPVCSVQGSRGLLDKEEKLPPPGGVWKSQIYPRSSDGWYWVYEGVAQGQTFVAVSARVETLRLRIARLNDSQPAAPLEVEIRSKDLQEIYVHGVIRPKDVTREFRWAAVELDHRALLRKGTTYVLLLHSKDTRHDAPWLLNATFEKLYSFGRHLGGADDLFFSLSFACGREVHVGPSSVDSPDLPINSGHKGGVPIPRRPTLTFSGRTRPAVAAHDPLGPIPQGQKVADVDLSSGRR